MKLSPGTYESALIAILKPQFYISRVFGLAPFTHDLQPSRAAALYSIVLVVLIPLGVFACNFGFYSYLLLGGITVQTFVTKASSTTAAGIAALFTVYTALTRTRSNLKELLTNLYRVDMLLARGDAFAGYIGVRRFVFIETCLLWGFFLLSGLLNFSALHLSTLHFYVSLGYYLFVNYITLAQFFNFVHYIRSKYHAINSSLESMMDNGETTPITAKSKETPLINVNEILPHQVRKSHAARKINVAPRTLTNAGKLAKIKELRQAHYLLQIVIEYLNKIFGLRMVGLLLYLLVDTISATYLLLKGVSTFKFETADTLALGYSFVTNVKNVLMLLTVTVGCHLTMEEAHHTPTLVQQCLLADGLGAQLKLELQQFAQQMLSSRPVFTASGLFDLDISLLLGVSASVATYTVILMTAK